MDFGVTRLDNLAYSNIKNSSFASANGAESKKLKWCGSGFVKQERTLNEDVFREFKLNETSNSGNFFEGQQQMLSFSSPNSQAVTWPYLQSISSPFSKNTGVRGSFLTPSQWIELEHQALIYKYITANVPVPSCLLNPIRKALESAGFSPFSGFKPSAFGRGGFHLGFSSTDPEPGRCRRTDGKKWRCARDAVADQKYCERHMNRGRHRSRKPVEGQSGHSSVAPNDSSKPAPAVPAGSASNALRLSHSQEVHSLELGIPSINVNRCVPQKDNTKGVNRRTTILSMATSGTDLKENRFDESSPPSEFGLVSSDSLLNPLDRGSPIVKCGNHSTSDDIKDQENKSKNPLQQFINNWPKDSSEQRSTFSWPDHLDLQPDGTQLSISIPVVTSDFVSPTLSPSKNELQANRMGLGFGKISTPRTEEKRIQANWIPISWEGGPLGEALNTTNNSSLESKNAKSLDLLESQDNSPRSAFGSLSSSS
ncbi:growth-regulating factor 1-like [Primulina huaijiensis]|uniref:growth-regulating factor 1-like n=1 Tax=Primulina huaijiensis TaxID=1492673 RepID=UPI003CC767B7